MLGAGKIIISTDASGGGAPTQPLSTYITPERVSVNVNNGSYTSPYFTCGVSGGVGPYSYSWTINDSQFTILTSSSDNRVRVSVGGSSETKLAALSCTVTDSESNTFTASAALVVSFGNQFGNQIV